MEILPFFQPPIFARDSPGRFSKKRRITVPREFRQCAAAPPPLPGAASHAPADLLLRGVDLLSSLNSTNIPAPIFDPFFLPYPAICLGRRLWISRGVWGDQSQPVPSPMHVSGFQHPTTLCLFLGVTGGNAHFPAISIPTSAFRWGAADIWPIPGHIIKALKGLL